MTPPLFLADDLPDGPGPFLLGGDEGRHGAQVRRVRPGETVEVTDGRGALATGTVRAVDRGGVLVDVLRVERTDPPHPGLTVVQALVKGDRGEGAVSMLTEVGVDTVVPWQAHRCVVRWSGDRAARGLQRWRSAAREASKQAHRPWAAVVAEPADTPGVLDLVRASPLAVVLHEAGGASLPAVLPARVDTPAVLVVGPEGGLTPEEVVALAAAGARVARMGGTVLRADTAGVAAAAVLLSRTARW